MERVGGKSLVLAALLVAPVLVRAQPEAPQRARARGEDVYLAGPYLDVTQDVPGDLLAAGGTVRVGASVTESAMVAGGNVAIDGPVGDDVIAAGGEVVLRGRTNDDARLAGGTVRIAGSVGDDATVAGGTVRIERDGAVGGRAWLAGGEIVVLGTVGRELRAAGRRVAIDGTVRGDVNVEADALEIGPAARIAGNVLHRGLREPRVDPGARIGGRVEHRPRAVPRGARAFGVVAGVLFVIALFATGAVMVLLFPRFTTAAAQRIETDPWRSLGVGVVALFGAPLVVLALLVTGIGVPLGLVLLAGYFVALLVGYLVAALFLGVLGVRRLGRQPAPAKGTLVLALLVALVVLGILQLVPVLGGLVAFAALLFGLGAVVLQLTRAYRGGGAQAMATEPAGPPRPG